ncbi:DUF116 domain-containing protein [Geovibrio thiophilus]|uniref:DUF116 domain-containing protein n=1 Tax=Geovibrio thiophilus TaxID=139438 RepID=A0A410JVY7_9BACT|nr:DUF116 domain-containing protein [Geovibrio thiophilus]QAR32195.1 DUF116 domain-containing protein [Geovibrio thiophilus]
MADSSRVLKLTRLFLIKAVFPLVLAAGRLLKTDRDTISARLIELNNRIVMRIVKARKPERAIILLPHCLQNENCELKITSGIYKCERCGRCDIEKLASAGERYNLSINIATGGSSALRLIEEAKPQIIAAVACERDLISGIRDIYPIPVIGICNRRPDGPCRNTRVDAGDVEDVLRQLGGM